MHGALIHFFSTLHNNFYVIGGWVLSGHIAFVFGILLFFGYKCWHTSPQLSVCTDTWNIYSHPFAKIHNTEWLEQDWPLTSAYWVHSNVYVLGNIHCTWYHTAVDPFHSTSSAVHTYNHLTSGSVEVPSPIFTRYSSSIGEEPVPYGRTIATSCLASDAEQAITTFTNLLQDHNTVVLVCCTIEWEPDITCTWEGRDTNYITS